MKRTALSGSEWAVRERRPTAWIGSALLAALIAACVGDESGQGSAGGPAGREREPSQPAEQAATSRVYLDTVAPLQYELFRETVDSEDPKKATYRFLLLAPGTAAARGKTMRVVLDSLGQADPALVAARAVLYELRPTSPTEGIVLPKVWGEWVPAEGWDSATAASRQMFHRSYIYHIDPGWSRSIQRASETSQQR